LSEDREPKGVPVPRDHPIQVGDREGDEGAGARSQERRGRVRGTLCVNPMPAQEQENDCEIRSERRTSSTTGRHVSILDPVSGSGMQSRSWPNVLRFSCKARLVMLVLSYPPGRALAAANAG
jgi:hypothetical protein